MVDKFEDPKIKDNKHMNLSRYSQSIPLFLLSSLVMTPVLLGVLIPASIVSQTILFAYNKVAGKKVKSTPRPTEDPQALIKQIKKRNTDKTGRIYDIVIFGATGFTGKLAAMYVAKQYGTTIRWAIAGRRRDALEKVKAELLEINADLKDLPLIIADSFDDASLDAMTCQTKVVVTTAGPFAQYGFQLVKSCALHGTHYCDITGETDFSRELIDEYDEVAKESGAKIVNFCGHDCVPWDLVVLESVKALKKEDPNQTLNEIHFYDEINSEPSGGTIATMFHALSNRTKRKTLLGFDPLLKTKTGDKSTTKLAVKNQMFLGYSSEYGSWVGPFVMSFVMANCVKRSNVLNNYSPKIVYKEAEVYPSFFAGYSNIMALLIFATSFVLPPWAYVLKTYLLPKQGEGPSKKKMDRGFLETTAFATGSSGTKVKAMLYFPTDPGYRDTARMLIESGLVLALQESEIKTGGGILTPAACQGSLLTKRLTDTGSIFKVEVLRK